MARREPIPRRRLFEMIERAKEVYEIVRQAQKAAG